MARKNFAAILTITLATLGATFAPATPLMAQGSGAFIDGIGLPYPGAPYPYWAMGASFQPVVWSGGVALQAVTVLNGTPAQTSGLEVGDLLIQANGRSMTSRAAFDAAMAGSDGRLRMVVRDVRTGRIVDLNATLGHWTMVGRDLRASMGAP